MLVPPGEVRVHGERAGMASVQVGRYEVSELLGQGGMGAVYLAHDPMLDRQVAIKIIHPKRGTPEAKERFLREARAVARLDSPYIIKIFDIGVQPPANKNDKELHFIVMEYIAGSTLSTLLEGEGLPNRAGLEKRLRIFWQLLQSIHYAHNQNVVHRDLKPDNVMLTSEGMVKIMDFGLAVLDNRHSQTRDDQIMGTMAYFAPEQAKGGKDVDHRADLYALGVILFEMVTGQLPFMGSNPLEMMKLVLEVAPPKPSSINQAIPPQLDNLILKALRKEPRERHSNAGEMLKDLERILESNFSQNPAKLNPLAGPMLNSPGVSQAKDSFADIPKSAPTAKGPGSPAVPTFPKLQMPPPPSFQATQTELLKKIEELKSGLNRNTTPPLAATQADFAAHRGADLQPELSPAKGASPAENFGMAVPVKTNLPVHLNPQGVPALVSSNWLESSANQSGVKGENHDGTDANPAAAQQMQRDDEVQKRHLIPGEFERPAERQTCPHCGSSQPLETLKCLDCGQGLNAKTSYFVIQREALECIKEAKELLRLGQFLEAQDAAEEALSHDESLGEAHLCLGRATLETENFELAEQALDKAAELLPDSEEPFLYLAELAMKRQDLEAVRAYLLEALERQPTSVSTRCRLAHLCGETGRVQESIEQYRLVIRTHPKHIQANRQLGVQLARLSRDDEALRYLEIAHKLDPKDPQGSTLIGRLYARKRNYTQAEEAFQSALQLNSDNAGLRAELGALYLAQNRENLALQELRKAVDYDPGNREARLRLASLYEKHGRVDFALGELKEALRFHPEDAVLHRKIGELYLLGKDLDRALTHFEDVVKLDPLCAEMHHKLGQIYLKKDYKQKSLELYRQAVELKKLNPEYREDLAMAYYCQGDVQSAVVELQKAARVANNDPNQGNYLKSIGMMFLELKNFDQAEDYLKASCNVQPNDAQTRGLLGQLFSRQGLTNLAIGEYRKALELQPNLSILNLYLAKALAAAGKHAEAIESFRTLCRSLGQSDDVRMAQDAQLGLADSYLQNSQFTEAEEIYRLALKREPHSVSALHGLAKVCLHKRQFGKGRDYLDIAVQVAPKDHHLIQTLAQFQGEQGQWSEAVLTLQKLLEGPVITAEIFEDLGRALRKAGRLAEAGAIYRTAGEKFPQKLGRFIWLEGRIEGRRERWTEAAKLYRRALEQFTHHAQIYLDLAQAYHGMGDVVEARRVLVQALENVSADKKEAIQRMLIVMESPNPSGDAPDEKSRAN
jgi:serine/threonine protein kinase/tetratricopeptide (TPR) repeat protein